MSDSSLTVHPTLTCRSEESEGELEEDLDYPDYDSDLEEEFFLDDYEDEIYDDYEYEEMHEFYVEDHEIPRQSPLSWAVQNEHTDIVRLLLNREDIKPDLADNEGRTPLFLACNSGYEEAVELLLERGAAIDPNVRGPWQTFSPLTAAAFHSHEGVVKLLLTHSDIDPNVSSYDGLTALSLAASGGHEGIVKLLLACGSIDLNSTEPVNGRRALGQAACNGHKGVVELLLACKGTEPNHLDLNCQTALSIAAENGHLGVVKALLGCKATNPSLGDVSNRSPLCYAICRGWGEMVKELVARPDLDLNESPVGGGPTALSLAVGSGDDEVVRILLERDDVDVNLADAHGRSPLWHAMESGNEVIAKILVARGGIKTGPE